MTDHHPHPTPLPQQAAELALAAPQVVAHRLSRLALAGLNPSVADQHELFEMGHEKLLAFSQGWLAMAAQWVQWQAGGWQALQALWLRPGPHGLGAVLHHWQHSAWHPWATLGAGLAPVHAKAMDNARRLGNTTLH